MAKPKVVVILSGCGVNDGAEIQESIMTLLALDKAGINYQCAAPNINQHHVINHLTGEEMNETRNVLVEAARIARGNIKDLTNINAADYDALVMPGGYGTAKNFTKWAFNGPEGEINPEVKRVINEYVSLGKPVVAFCMSPVVLAKALENANVNEHLTVGTTERPTIEDIAGINAGMASVGAVPEMVTVDQIVVDEPNKIITAPCYMMEASISEVNIGIEKAINKLFEML